MTTLKALDAFRELALKLALGATRSPKVTVVALRGLLTSMDWTIRATRSRGT